MDEDDEARVEYYKFLYELFPSKHLEQKIESIQGPRRFKIVIDNLKKRKVEYDDADDECADDEDSSSDYVGEDTEESESDEEQESMSEEEQESASEAEEEQEAASVSSTRINLMKLNKILKSSENNNNELVTYFKNADSERQAHILSELENINNEDGHHSVPQIINILDNQMPLQYKTQALKKIKTLMSMDQSQNEYHKMKNWLDTFIQIPFGIYKTLDVSISDGVEKCHDFMLNAQKTLDSAVYGLNDAKMQILQMLGLWVTNPSAIGTSIAIKGPPGTGKTSLVKEGISKILGRHFEFIPLGGATDSGFLEGYSYTYEGSMWGKIVQTIINSKSMNPVIYFDELDKISETPKGEEIVGILTHLTDTSQNSEFHDKYFSDVNFDLSKCLFIFSYNDETRINPILKDRMYRIYTKGYEVSDKLVICKNYLLPKLREQVKFSAEDVILPDETIKFIIQEYTQEEEGVRNLKRCLEVIYTKLNLYRLIKTNIFEKNMDLVVEFPLKVTPDIVRKLVKQNRERAFSLGHLYI